MEVSGDLWRGARGVRLVAKDGASDAEFLARLALAKIRRLGIVVSADPYPFKHKCAKRGKRGPVGNSHAFASANVVEAVAEANRAARLINLHNGSKPLQRVVAVERRQKPAARRAGRSLLQMQVGNDQRAMLRQIRRAARVERNGKTRELDRDCARPSANDAFGVTVRLAARLSQFLLEPHAAFLQSAGAAFNRAFGYMRVLRRQCRQPDLLS